MYFNYVLCAKLGQNGSTATFLPEADQVARRITDGRNPQVSFGVGRSDNLTTVRQNPIHGHVDAIDIEVWHQTRVP